MSSSSLYKVCTVGLTGEGKSEFLNCLCSDEAFHASSGSHSDDTLVNSDDSGMLFGTQARVRRLDTHGYNDSKGRDAEQTKQLAKRLVAEGYIHALILVVNFQYPRFPNSMFEQLRILAKMFGHGNMWDHLVVVFTRCSEEEDASKIKQREEQTLEKIRGVVKEGFGDEAANKIRIPMFFLDSCNVNDDQQSKGNLERLVTWILALDPLNTSDVKDPGKYLSEEEEFKEVVVERDEKPIFIQTPIMGTKPVSGGGSNFEVNLGICKFGFGGTKMAVETIKVGERSEMTAKTCSEKINVLRRMKRLWFDNKTVSYSPWEVIETKSISQMVKL